MDNFKNSKADIGEFIKKATENAKGTKDVNSFIEENLSASQANAVKELLKDEEKTRALLNSEAAREIFKKFFGGGSNGGF